MMKKDYITELKQKCVECGQCAESCALLSESGQSPLKMAERGIEINEALSCSLCGACEAACPLGLSPRQLFVARRREAINNSEIDSSEYRYLLPDRKNNVMSAYRNYFGTDYSDINSFDDAGTCFFPGCTLMTYSPGLTREIFARLQSSCDCQGFWTECCGKLPEQIGLQKKAEDMRNRLKEFVRAHNVKRIIVACPGCYYELQEIIQACDVVVQTVYEVMDFGQPAQNDDKRYAVHDSCPDRFAGIFGNQVRRALEKCHYSTVEMGHNGKNAICCGSGGQLSHFRPDLVEELVKVRQDEAQKAGADILVGYCLSCVLKYDGSSSEIPVTHALNLLLGLKEDYTGAKKRAQKMFSGSDGEKRWEEIMAE